MSNKNKKILVIVESPSKSKHISDYLKAAGYTHATVVASVGHISNLADNKSSYKNTGIYPDEDFRMNIALTEDKKDVVKKLKDLVAANELVYLMTDGDREGEAIAWSLVKFLKLKKGQYFRSITHEITPKAVINAIENPVKLDENLVEAAHARMAVDKMVGYSLSPVAKAYIGAKSVGRCQSAGLKLIVDREKEINDFRPETFYDIYLHFDKNKTEFKAKYIGTDKEPIQHLKTQAEVNVVKFKCSGDYVVKDIVEKTQKEFPQLPYTTASLQQDISSKLGLKVKDIMSICQSLFEHGFISYHRSDSPLLAEEFVEIAKNYIELNYAGLYLGQKEHKKKENEQDGHEAIRCTDVALSPSCSAEKIKNELHKKVYDLIWKRTMQSLAIPAEFAVQKIIITNNGQNFEFEQKVLKEPGFKKIS